MRIYFLSEIFVLLKDQGLPSEVLSNNKQNKTKSSYSFQSTGLLPNPTPRWPHCELVAHWYCSDFSWNLNIRNTEEAV